MTKLNSRQRLERISHIIEDVDNRCMAADGPVTPTLDEMRQSEIKEIYDLARGWRIVAIKRKKKTK